jgi:hypothetical protein
MRKWYIDDCHKSAKNHGGQCLSTKYIGISTNYEWKCKLGHTWFATYANIKKGTWCAQCSKCKKLTLNDCIETAKGRNGYCLSTKYINNIVLMEWECKEKHRWNACYSSIRNGTWCGKCYGNTPLSIEDCSNIANQHDGYCLETKYINNHTKIGWKCKNNHIWKAALHSIKDLKTWCPYCDGNIKSSLDACKIFAKNKNGECLSAKYINARKLILWKCSKGHIFKNNWDHVKNRDQWCPRCNERKRQKNIANIIAQLFPLYNIKYNFRGFDWLKTNNKSNYKQEIDIWIPEIKLAIEYDGEQHFKPVCFGGVLKEKAQENFKKQKQRDRNKNKKIAQHQEEIKYFIRFNYKEKLTKAYIIFKLKKLGIIQE